MGLTYLPTLTFKKNHPHANIPYMDCLSIGAITRTLCLKHGQV